MQGKRPAECSIVLSHVMLPEDANPAGNVHGGVIMKYIDSAAGVVAARHARCNVVTASIDRLDFHNPGYIGNLLTLKATLNWTGTTSMEIGVRAEMEDLMSGEIRHIASAYLTYVALDKSGRPTQVPALVLETEDEIRRNRMSIARRKARSLQDEKEKKCQTDMDACD
jgi:acyl-CoA hydrolase